MSQLQQPLDNNPIIRYLHIHCFSYIFRLFHSNSKVQLFPKPRFKMFEPIKKIFMDQEKHRLFKNLLYTYRLDIIQGIIITIIYASLGLLIPQIIKQFMSFLKDYDVDSKDITKAHYITEKYALLQLLRTIFGTHTRRLFDELAIKIESTLAIKLVRKALLMKKQYRSIWHESEIFHFQNIDLKLIHKLFRHLYFVIEIPFTIVVAICMLFSQNVTYGIIGLYWFTIAFLIQRNLDDKMIKCNVTKWKLIEKRSKLNYEFMDKITLSRLNREEGLLVEKNNDFFIAENHDHTLFYRYSTLYDITQILLPITVVISIAIYDYNELNPFTVQQVFVMLSLLGICYMPMKNYRKFNINLADGLESLRRITLFFDLPEEDKPLDDPHTKRNQLVIAANTVAEYNEHQYQLNDRSISKSHKIAYNSYKLQMQINHQIEVNKGERLVVLGRKGQGNSMFLNFLLGELKILSGSLSIGTRIAYLPEDYFLCSGSIAENFIFYNKNCTIERANEVYKELGLEGDLRFTEGINQLVSVKKFTDLQLKKLNLGRIFCANADIFILDCPFEDLDIQSIRKVNEMLRRLQEEGKIVILTTKILQFPNPEDKILIINLAKTIEYNTYAVLSKNINSSIGKFIKNDKINDQIKSEAHILRLVKKFQIKVKRALVFMTLNQKEKDIKDKKENLDKILKTICQYSEQLKQQVQSRAETKKKDEVSFNFKVYLKKFMTTAPLSETIFILVIILAAEVLHIFIHFYIGHQYEHYSKKGLSSLKTLMIYELILTLGLCAIIFLEGEVSSALAVIKGNRLYKKSLQEFSLISFKWYQNHYAMRLANIFNHDYQEIFILFHSVLEIFKNVVILIITILLVGGNKYVILFITILVAALYYAIQKLVSRSLEIITTNHEKFKYEFVKIFHESVEGANSFHIFGVEKEVIHKAKEKYLELSSYKQATNYSRYGQSLLCEIASIFIGTIVLEFGIGSKAYHINEGLIVTSILLLMNLSDVLKAVANISMYVETFFSINLLPFMEIADVRQSTNDNQLNSTKQHTNTIHFPHFTNHLHIQPNQNTPYDIFFNSVILVEDFNMSFENYPIQVKIKEGEKVVFVEINQFLRQQLLASLTQNVEHLQSEKNRTIFIGGQNISSFSSSEFSKLVGVISSENFYLSGTLRINLEWGISKFNESEAEMFCQLLEVENDLPDYAKNKLDCYLVPYLSANSIDANKKIALIKILIRKPKIIVIFDTLSFIEKWNIVDLLSQYIPRCTIIKISKNVEEVFEMDRIIYTENMKIREDGNPQRLYNDRLSWVGDRLRQGNRANYQYLNKVSHGPRKIKSETNIPIKPIKK